jgi:molybdopterin/thiamine biosynthesis adenylyltransferase/rhodanese-related sulfurtransferase/molybdopterin converting factor small subunit
MPIEVQIPTALRNFADNQKVLRFDGDTVGGILNQLASDYPKLKPHLFADDGRLRNFVNVYVNEDDIRSLLKQETKVKEGDVILIVPAVAGGAVEAAREQDWVSGTGVELSKEEIERYSRHLIMPEVGMAGQRKLKAASVLCIGTGGLGSPLALYLAAAGVGKIGLVDFDVVDVTNLQRQILHGTRDVGRSKLDSARETIGDINPHVEVQTYETRITSGNAMELIAPYDLVVDGTDNFPTRYLVNDACVLSGKPNVYGSIFRFEGQASVFWAEKGPCYRCLFPEPPPPGLVPSCAEGGVLGILPGIIGLIQATETIKLILGSGDSMIGRLLLFDALGMKFRELKLRKDPECPVCGENPTVTELIDYEHFCGIGTPAGAIDLAGDEEVRVGGLQTELTAGSNLVLLDVREPHEYDICRLENATLIPLGQLDTRIGELDRSNQHVVYCRSGARSAKAVKLMREAGFSGTRNLVGGILAWADEIDPAMPKY